MAVTRLLLMALMVTILSAGLAHATDWIEERVVGFKNVKALIARIDDALSDGKLDKVGADAHTVANFAARIPDLFPAGSGQGGKTSASTDIWIHFADFSSRADAFRRAAETLAHAAETGNRAGAEESFSALRSTCKSCHIRYKDLF